MINCRLENSLNLCLHEGFKRLPFAVNTKLVSKNGFQLATLHAVVGVFGRLFVFSRDVVSVAFFNELSKWL